jgi:heme-degrading monooxygenase HmoA
MYARMTLLEIDTLRSSMDEALARFRRDVAPALREQPGYRGVYVMSSPEGKGALLSLWDTESQASGEADGFYTAALEQFATIFRAPPGRERYEVVFVDEVAPTG